VRDPRFSVLAADAKCVTVAALLAGGRLLVFDGERPEAPDDNVTTQVLLALVELPSPAFEPPEAGRMTAAPLDPGPSLATGTPTWFRAETTHGDAVWDGTCGPMGDPVLEKYDMFVGDVEADGEFEVGRLVYVERRR